MPDLAYAAGLALGLAIVVAFGFLARREAVVGFNDFTYAWAGARAVLDGKDPYDPQVWPAIARAYATARPHENVFGYPPWVALALAPLALLPIPIASGVWTFGGMALAALALRALLRSVAPNVPLAHFLAGLALFASQPGTANVWTGQWSFVLVAALATTATAVRERGRLGLVSAVALLGKPHLFFFALPALARTALARDGVRSLAILVVPLLAVVAIGWLAFPGWLDAWRTGLFAQRFAIQPPTTLDDALGDLLGPQGRVVAATIVLLLAGAGLAFDPRSDASLAVWLAVSAATPVYAWSYDQLVLVVPLVLATGALAGRSPRAAARFAAAGFGFFLIAPMLLYAVADARENESFNAFVPLAVAVLCLGALWPQRMRRAATLPREVAEAPAPRLIG